MARRVPRRRLYDHEAARDAVEILVELIRFLWTRSATLKQPGQGTRPRIQRFYHDLLLAGPEKGVKDHVGLLKVETSAMWPTEIIENHLGAKMQRDTLDLHQTTAALLIHEYRTSPRYTPEVRVAHHSLRQRWVSPCMAGRGQNQAGRSAQPAARSPRRRGFRSSSLAGLQPP